MRIATAVKRKNELICKAGRFLTGREHAIAASKDMIAFRADVPFRIVQVVATALEWPIRRISRKQGSRQDSNPVQPISMGLALGVMYPLVAVLAAFDAGVLLPDSPYANISLTEDYHQIFLMVASPLALVLGADFYFRVFRSFKDLHGTGVIRERTDGKVEFKEVLNRLHSRLNSWRWQFLFAPLSVAGAIYAWWQANLVGERWVAHISIGPDIWLIGMTILGWWVTLFFAYKCVTIGVAVSMLTHKDNFEWTTPDVHNAGADAITALSWMWLRVHLIVVLIGSFILVFAAATNAWTQPTVVFGIVFYILLAPAIFFGPLAAVHGVMKDYKTAEVHAAGQELESARTQVNNRLANGGSASLNLEAFLLLDFREKEFSRKLALQTWPMSIVVTRVVWATYLLPIPMGMTSAGLFRLIAP